MNHNNPRDLNNTLDTKDSIIVLSLAHLHLAVFRAAKIVLQLNVPKQTNPHLNSAANVKSPIPLITANVLQTQKRKLNLNRRNQYFLIISSRTFSSSSQNDWSKHFPLPTVENLSYQANL